MVFSYFGHSSLSAPSLARGVAAALLFLWRGDAQELGEDARLKITVVKLDVRLPSLEALGIGHQLERTQVTTHRVAAEANNGRVSGL